MERGRGLDWLGGWSVLFFPGNPQYFEEDQRTYERRDVKRPSWTGILRFYIDIVFLPSSQSPFSNLVLPPPKRTAVDPRPLFRSALSLPTAPLHPMPSTAGPAVRTTRASPDRERGSYTLIRSTCRPICWWRASACWASRWWPR